MTSKNESLKKLLSDAAIVLALTSAYLFLAGWGYETGFFKVFGLNTTMFELSFQEYAVGSLFALYSADGLTFLLFTAVMIGLVWYAVNQFVSWLQERGSSEARGLIVPVTAAIVFIVLVWTVNATANIGVHRAKEYLGSAERVHLIFKAENRKLIETYEANLLNANDQDQLRFCFETKDLVVVFENLSGSSSKAGRTYVLERADLALVRVGIGPKYYGDH